MLESTSLLMAALRVKDQVQLSARVAPSALRCTANVLMSCPIGEPWQNQCCMQCLQRGHWIISMTVRRAQPPAKDAACERKLWLMLDALLHPPCLDVAGTTLKVSLRHMCPEADWSLVSS